MSIHGSIMDAVEALDNYNNGPLNRELHNAGRSLACKLKNAIMRVQSHGSETVLDSKNFRVLSTNTTAEVLSLLFKIRHIVEKNGRVIRMEESEFIDYAKGILVMGNWARPGPIKITLPVMRALRKAATEWE